VEAGKLERTFGNHLGSVNAVAFRPRGAPVFCATASDDKTVRLWQPSIGRMVRIVRGHGSQIFALVFSKDGKQIISIGREGIGRIIDADSDKVLHEWKAHDDWTYALAIDPQGRLATGDWSGEVKLWVVKDGKVTRR